MTKMKQSVDLSRLIEFLHQTFIFTEDVKHVLKSNCNEAIISLKPWCIEVNSQQDLSKDVCTCPKAETEVEEIAAGISKTLLQTQQLREKLSFNIVKGKNSNRLNVTKICSLQSLGNREQPKKNVSTSNRKLLSGKYVNTVKQTMQGVNLNRRSPKKVVTENVNSDKEIRSYDEQLIARSGKFLGTKNFLAINKWNVKNKNIIMKHKVGESSKSSSSMSSCTASDDKFSATSINELKCLLQKVSLKPNSDSFSKMHNTKCPLHENAISKYEQNFATVDVMDSINIINIPAEIIKPLKVYHTYLNTDFTKRSINIEKQQKTVNRFLMEFHKIDKVIQKSLVQKAHNITLLTKYMSFFQILFSENVETFNTNDIKTMYTELQCTWKTFAMEESDTVKIFKSDLQQIPLCSTFNLTEWMSNGIWNLSCSRNFKEMSTMFSIHYTDKNYLLFFYELVQQLQHIDYYKNLINMILKEILPNMKVSFDSTDLEYIKMYKMIYILYQGLNPKIPVLVNTSK